MANYNPKEKIGRVFMMVDLDDTIANNEHRQYLLPNWNAFHKACENDIPNTPLIKELQNWSKKDGVTMVFVTGRTGLEEVKTKTIQWLKDNGFDNPWVEFRTPNSYIKNDILKSLTLEKLMEKSGVDEKMEMIVVEDTIKVFETFKDKFKFKIHEVYVDMKNPSNNPVEKLREVFKSIGYKEVVKNTHFKH